MDDEQKKLRWQYKLLPFIIPMIVVLALFFFLASLVQMINLHNRIDKFPEVNKVLIEDPNMEKSLLALELLLIEKRYHQANTSLMSRIWLKYLGFVTGMILSIIGATFVLAKLREQPTNVQLSTRELKFSLISSSPGIILAILGTLIMVITIYRHNPIDLYDSNIYLPSTNTNKNNIPYDIIKEQPNEKDTSLIRPKIE